MLIHHYRTSKETYQLVQVSAGRREGLLPFQVFISVKQLALIITEVICDIICWLHSVTPPRKWGKQSHANGMKNPSSLTIKGIDGTVYPWSQGQFSVLKYRLGRCFLAIHMISLSCSVLGSPWQVVICVFHLEKLCIGGSFWCNTHFDLPPCAFCFDLQAWPPLLHHIDFKLDMLQLSERKGPSFNYWFFCIGFLPSNGIPVFYNVILLIFCSRFNFKKNMLINKCML